MATLESVFVSEFKRKMQMIPMNRNVFSIPLPKECSKWSVSGSDYYAIKGIREPLFSKLNQTVAKRLPGDMIAARRKVDLVTRDFLRDEKGRFIYEDVKVPTGSKVVISTVNLNLPYNYKPKEGGYGYIDFINTTKGREYLYFIPKTCIYETHQLALAVSTKTLKSYGGMGYKTWGYGTVFLSVIPYKPMRVYVGTKILATSLSDNFSNEIRTVVDFWMKNGVIPDLALCNTENGNIDLKEIPVAYSMDEFYPIEEYSLGDKEIYGSAEEDTEDE